MRHRLQNIATARSEDLQFLLTRYSLERLLYRLSISPHKDRFVLKGAMLFQVWTDQQYRPTRDLDFLGRGEISAADAKRIFAEICRQPVLDDGLDFDAEAVRVEPIRENNDYRGLRVKFECRLGNARIPIQIDIGLGDAITPRAQQIDYPVLLDSPKPRLKAYPRETVIAEKFQAMVSLGIANSRFKDFYDIWMLSRLFSFDGELLSRAIAATFKRRKTQLPAQTPIALSNEYAADGTNWRGFLSRNTLDDQAQTFVQVVRTLRNFLLPPVQALVDAKSFKMTWPSGGPWRL